MLPLANPLYLGGKSHKMGATTHREELTISNMLLNTPDLARDQVLLLATTAMPVSGPNRSRTPESLVKSALTK